MEKMNDLTFSRENESLNAGLLRRYEYNYLLQFTYHDDEKSYQEFVKQEKQGPFYMITLFLLVVDISSRVNFGVGFATSWWLAIASVEIVLANGIFLLILLDRNRDYLWPVFSSLFNTIKSLNIFKNFTICCVENMFLILLNLSFQKFFIGRVLLGECPANVSWFKGTWLCNPLHKSNSPPVEMIIIFVMAPLYFQMLFQNIKKRVLLVLWLMNFSVTLWSIAYLDAWVHNYLITFSSAIILIQYTYERKNMSNFQLSKRASDNEKITAEQERQKRIEMERVYQEKMELLKQLNDARINEEKRRIDMQIIEINAKNEVKLKETESLQLRSLMGNVAHDLLTPIQSAHLDIEQLKMFFNKSFRKFPELKEYAMLNEDNNPMLLCDSLESCNEFMEASAHRCMDYTKFNCNIALKPVLKTFDLNKALKTPLRCIKTLLSRDVNDRIIVHPISKDINMPIISDPHWYKENLLCLLSNAVKYSNDNSPVSVSTELVTSSENGIQMIRVSVEDNGIGVSEADRKMLFQQFKQVQRMAGGTGLGLFSMKNRMKALNGSCGVKSRADGISGSVFWFEFPYCPDYSATAVKNNKILSHKRPSLNEYSIAEIITSLKIMLVDDSLLILKAAKRAFESNGHTVEMAKHGLEGLNRLKKTFLEPDFDVLLTDLQMPTMDGFTFVSKLREYENELLEQGYDIHSRRKCRNKSGRFLIIGMSASNDETNKQLALDCGIDFFMPKPIGYTDFVSVMQQFLK